MVTFVSQVPATVGPAAPASAVGGAVDLTDVARQALSRISTMQSDLNATMQQMDGLTASPRSGAATAARPVDAPGQIAETSPSAGTMDQSLDRTAEMMALTSQVQAQLLQFSMATSVSSNMGRNLNTFLKGQ